MTKYFTKEGRNYIGVLIFEGNLTSEYLYVFSLTMVNSIDEQPCELKKVFLKKIKNTIGEINNMLIYPNLYKQKTKDEVKELINKFIDDNLL